MVNQSLISSLSIEETEAFDLLAAEFGSAVADGDMEGLIEGQIGDFKPGTILQGKIIGYAGDDFLVEVGLKSEGVLDKNEFDDAADVEVGDTVEVLLEEVEGDDGMVQLSKRKADRIRGWERIITEKDEGDTVDGKVMRKIKGGLLVDIGVPVFLPASQVDIRRPADIGIFIGETIEAQILKIDEQRRNIVISRRKLIEERRTEQRQKLLSDIKEGDLVSGMVKNIADFGAFVDLGGIDGLLHITDMSWGRVNHPSDIVKLDEKIEVKVLSIDYDKEKIALGLKQKDASPWEDIEQKYPQNTRIRGTVTNIMSYGAFVKLEEGVEGLVHISEMSWTRRINHPSEMVSIGEEVEVVVLDINKDKQEISLGMKQTEVNPWELVAEKYPPGTIVEGKVRNLASYGAFIEIEPGIDGLLHVSDLSWTKKLSHPNEMLKKGETIKCIVLEVDQEKQRVALGLKQMTEDPWLEAIPTHYQPGMIVQGKVTKITNFGVFVELEEDLEGLLHISELADHKVENPQDVVQVGQDVEVKILRVDLDERKIGLSLKRAQWTSDQEAAAEKAEGGSKGGAADSGAGGIGGLGDDLGHLGTDKITFGGGN
ncbi:30S ribosomal protein S1 [Poriferisphaera corsica]|uniref:30S ribosomal protein S1 n=1 Tax=Poriferisphaera corsica TaxID=2528020 RepID=A0A517YUH9_9BACT|nr:30S ribosomal protein S1 [Poriferisphaera corsica]QDU33857.1 30S ribosomal protein S1 [Poriferisphaera corsica]